VALISLVVQDGPILRIVEEIHNKQNDAGALEESNLLAKTSSSKIATFFLRKRQHKVININFLMDQIKLTFKSLQIRKCPSTSPQSLFEPPRDCSTP
jgi:hypothetical protein